METTPATRGVASVAAGTARTDQWLAEHRSRPPPAKPFRAFSAPVCPRSCWMRIGQGPAVDELHGVIMDAALAADAIDGDDVLMVQMGGRLGLVLEALDLLGVQGGRQRQHLEGNAPAQRKLLRLVHDPHAASADLAEDAKVPQRHARSVLGRTQRGDGRPIRAGLAQIGSGRMHELQGVQAFAPVPRRCRRGVPRTLAGRGGFRPAGRGDTLPGPGSPEDRPAGQPARSACLPGGRVFQGEKLP